MTEEPIAPGGGLPVYQPATAVVDGTCSEPPAAMPSVTSRVRTPMAGMISSTGRAAGRAAAEAVSGAAAGPPGACVAGTRFRPNGGVPAGPVTASPASPMLVASTPSTTMTVAGQPGAPRRAARHPAGPGSAERGRRCRPAGRAGPPRSSRKPGRPASAVTSPDVRGRAPGPAVPAEPGDPAQGQHQAEPGQHQPGNR